jgi:hypothetical protein
MCQHDICGVLAGTSEDFRADASHSRGSATTSPSETFNSASEAPTRSTDPPPAAWRRLEELEARMDALVSRMHADRAPKPPQHHFSSSHTASAFPQRAPHMHRSGNRHEGHQPMHMHVHEEGGAAALPAGTEEKHSGQHSSTPERLDESSSDVRKLAEKLSEIELAEKAIFDRWFHPDGTPKTAPLSLPLRTKRCDSRNSNHEHPAEAHTADTATAHATPAAQRSVHSSPHYTGQENQGALNAEVAIDPPSLSSEKGVHQCAGLSGARDVCSSPTHLNGARVVDMAKQHQQDLCNKQRGLDGERAEQSSCAHDDGRQENASDKEADEGTLPHMGEDVLSSLPLCKPQEDGGSGGLGRTDTLASACTACTSEASDDWRGLPGGQTSRNILRRTHLCMHGLQDVCAHCIGNTPRRPGDTVIEAESEHESPGSPVHAQNARDIRSTIQSLKLSAAHDTDLFTKAEVDKIIAVRDEFVAKRAEQDSQHLLLGGFDVRAYVSQHQEQAESATSQCIPNMQRSVFAAAVETLADNVIDAVVEDHVQAMLDAVDSAAARVVAEECVEQLDVAY